MLDRIYPNATLDNEVSIKRLFKQYGVQVCTSHKILEFTDKGLKAESKDGIVEMEADTIILALGMKPNAGITKELIGTSIDAVKVGDCTGIGQIGEAVRAGFYAARGIE